MKLRNLKMITSACPTQWEAKNEEGEYVYIRYRFGILSASVGEDHKRAFSDVVGDGLDGTMSTEDMLKHTQYVTE